MKNIAKYKSTSSRELAHTFPLNRLKERIKELSPMERDVIFRKSNWHVIGFIWLYFSSYCIHTLLMVQI